MCVIGKYAVARKPYADGWCGPTDERLVPPGEQNAREDQNEAQPYDFQNSRTRLAVRSPINSIFREQVRLDGV
jgi:hypothetical protein